MREFLFLDRNNPIVVECQEDGVASTLSGISKAEFQLFAKDSYPLRGIAASFSADSITNASLFDLTEASIGKIGFYPDDAILDSLTTGTYYGRFILYFTNYPDGIVWGDLFKVELAK